MAKATINTHGALVQITRTLSRIALSARPKAFKDYISSAEYKSMYAALDDNACERVLDAVMEAKRACFSGKAIPARINYRVRWDEPTKERLRQLEAKFGNDYDIAREMQLPLKVVRPARWKYCGRRRVRNQPHSLPLLTTRAAA